MNVVVVIPAFNEAAAVGQVVRAARELGRVVLVDDASSDETGKIARLAGADVVRHERNRGYDAALASGFDRAIALGADAILTMDGDGQHVPEIGRQFVECLAGPADVVVGRRPHRARWSEHVFALYTRVRFGLPDPLCGMKAFRCEIVSRHRAVMDRTTIGAGLTVAALSDGARLAVVDVPIRERAGRSRFGQGLRANVRILSGLWECMLVDLRTARARDPDTQRGPETAVELVLGTAQFSTGYGAVRHSPDETGRGAAHDLLAAAVDLGFAAFDTAPTYGDAESLIGTSGLAIDVHTKIDPELGPRASLARSLERLRRPEVAVLYFHDPAIALDDPNGTIDEACSLIGAGVDVLGASVYEPAHFEAAAADPRFGAVQVPLNVFDRRIPPATLEAANESGTAIFARSVLLQGVLAVPPEQLPAGLSELAPHVDAFRALARRFETTVLRLALAWVRSLPGVSGIVVGAESNVEARELVDAARVTLDRDLVQALFEFSPPDQRLVDPRTWTL